MDLEKLIRDLANKNHITAYEIAKNTSISVNTVRNVLNNSKVKSKQKTLLIILDYLENTIAGTTGEIELKEEYTTDYRNDIAAESPEKYNFNFSELKIDDKLNVLHKTITLQEKKIDLLLKALSSVTLSQEDILEIISENQNHQK